MSADASERRLAQAWNAQTQRDMAGLREVNYGLFLALQHWYASNGERVRDSLPAVKR